MSSRGRNRSGENGGEPDVEGGQGGENVTEEEMAGAGEEAAEEAAAEEAAEA